MQHHSRSHGRKGVAGIVAGLILFVILFSVGTGYFLWVNTNDQSYIHALANRNNEIQAQQEESLTLAASVNMSSGYLVFAPTNTGSEPVNITTVIVTDTSGNPLEPQMDACANNCIVVNSGSTGSTYQTNVQYCSTSTTCSASTDVVKVVTQRGNVFSVTYSPPELTTSLIPSSTITAGQSVTDTAILSSITNGAGGSVSFYSFTGANSCPASGTGGTGQGTTFITNGGPTSFSSGTVTYETAGSYSWDAVYTGDAGNPPSVSPCEALTVRPTASPGESITTVLSPGASVTVGTQVYDTATLAGVTTNAGGTVSFFDFTGSVCGSGATQVGSPEPVTNGVVTPSTSATFNSQGSYSWKAVYSGDSSNGGVTSSCEPLTVAIATPKLSTTLSASSVVAGSAVYDSATLTGASSNAGGAVTFYFSSTNVCPPPGGITQVGSLVPVAGGGTYQSSSYTFATAGVYYWYASYTGDINNQGATSSCETLTVQAKPAISTALSNPSIAVGGEVQDTATISGAAAGAGGSVSFWWSLVNACPTQGATLFSTVPVTGNGNYLSSPSQPLSTAGTYYVYADYSGDANNAGQTSNCEVLTVGLAVTTSLSATTIAAGGSVYDTSTLHFATPTAGGTVSYYYFLGNACPASNPLGNGGTLVGTPVSVTNGVVPQSNAVTFGTVGSYAWESVYSGDANNQGPVTSPCEQLAVLPSTQGGSGGSLGLVSESFRFYFTNCNPQNNPEGVSSPCPPSGSYPGLGDGTNIGGYYGYGLSFNPLPTCQTFFFFGCLPGSQDSANPDVFQIKVTNTDPSRTITLSAQSFLFIQGQCSVGFLCSFLTTPFAQSYWIVSPPTSSGGEGATPQPYNVNSPVTIPPGGSTALYFYCIGGPCTSSVSPSPGGTETAPPAGESLVVSVGLYGIYSDGTPFAQTIPYVASYVSPVYISSVSPAQPNSLHLSGSIGSTITLTAAQFPVQPGTVSVYWTNADGTTSVVGTSPGSSCTSSGSPATWTCSVTLTIPPSASAGSYYGIYVTSDGVDNAYATVYVKSATATNVACTPSSIVTGATSLCTVTVTGASPTGTITMAASAGPGTVTFPGGSTCTLSGGSCTITVSGATAGSVTLTASYSGDANNGASTGTGTLSVGASITVSPASGPAGTLVTVTGVGFAPTSTITIKFNGVTVPTNPATVTTSGAGGFSATFTVPSSSNGAQTVSATDASTNAASATFTVTTATLTLTPNTGPTGTGVTLSGSGYAPSTLYAYCFRAATSTPCPSGTGTTFTSTAGGAIPSGVTIAVPSSSNSFVAVSQGTSGTNFVISAPFTVTTATLSVSPARGPPTTITTLTGAGYAPSTSYGDCLSTSSVAVSCVAGSSSTYTTTTGGAIPTGTTVTVPTGTAAGSDFIISYFGTTVVTSQPFSVTTPTLALVPSQGPIGVSVAVSGSGFSPSTNIGSITISGGTISTQTCTAQTTTATGTFSCTFTVPTDGAGGHSVTLSGADVGTVTGDAASATYTVTVPGITLTPNAGPVGTAITVAGTGFSVNTAIGSISITGGTILTQTCTSQTTSATGTFSCTFSLPTDGSGAQTVVVSGSDTGTVPADTASAAATVTVATLTLTPNTGPVGTTVTLSGTGYAPSTTYAYCFRSSAAACPSGTATTFTSTAGGAIPAGTTIPVPSSGNTFVDVSQGTSGTNFIISATFTVTTPTLSTVPVQGPPTTKTTLSGSGYAPSTIYSICLSTTSGTVNCVAGSGTTFTATVAGAIPGATTVTVPSGTAAGSDFVIVYSGAAVVDSTAFKVTTPTISLSPTQGPVGVTVTVTGSGFSASTTVGSITIAGGTISTQTCTAQTTSAAGAFSCTFVVPSESAGGHTVTASGSDVATVTGDTALATFTVTTPAIVLSPTSGAVGTSVTVTGSGYSVNTLLGSITITGGSITTQTCTSTTTSGTGAFTCTFTVPSESNGAKTVTISGSDLGSVPADSAGATFTVGATKALVFQTANTGCVGSSSCSSASETTTTGDLLVVTISYYDTFTTHTISSVSDGFNSYSQAVLSTPSGGGFTNRLVTAIYYSVATHTGSVTLTVTVNSGGPNTAYSITYSEYSGSWGATPLTTTNTGSCTSGSGCSTSVTTPSTAYGTLTLLIGSSATHGGDSLSAGSGFNALTGACTTDVCGEYVMPAASGSTTFPATASGNDDWADAGAVFTDPPPGLTAGSNSSSTGAGTAPLTYHQGTAWGISAGHVMLFALLGTFLVDGARSVTMNQKRRRQEGRN